MLEPAREFKNTKGNSTRQRATLGLAIFLVLACGLTGRSQTGSMSPPSDISTHPGPDRSPQQVISTSDPSDLDPITQERRLRALNIERQKEMISDANKLLKLAKELNDEVASAHAESLTQAQLHKIAEIEKLAHSVKERMTIGVGQAPGLEPTTLVPFPAMHGPQGP